MQHSEVVLRIGVEVDYFPETAAAVSQQIRMQDLDYVIGSVHFVDNFPIDEDAEHWEALAVAERDEMWRRYWERIVLLAESGWCDVVGHLDLPKKFWYRPSRDLKEEEGRALAAVAAAGLAIELNTNGWNKPVAEAYPSLSLLRQAQMRGVPVMISADAHRPEEVVQHFERAYELARAAGYRELVRFAERKRSAYPL
jgi:histidinol-phosphatase (PHP family)